MGKRIALVVVGCVLILALAAVVLPAQEEAGLQSRNVWISEVVTSNARSLADDIYGSPDWIELYNASNHVVDLTGYGLSKSVKNPYVFTFPAMQLQPGEHVVVYACETLPGVAGRLCTGFRMPKSGVELLLTDANGTIVQKLAIPELYEDVSYGMDQAGKYQFYAQPTPGEDNGGVFAQTLAELLALDTGGLRINEVLPRASRTTGYGWVELYNASEKPIDLGTYFLTDAVTNPDKAKLPAVTLDPGAYYLIPFGESGLPDSLPFSIGKQETMLRLNDQFGGMVDEITWDAMIFDDVSVGIAADGSQHYFEAVTPGTENSATYLETEAFIMQEGLPTVYVNELLRKNTFSLMDEDGERSPWLEVYNGGQNAVSLKGYYVSDDAWNPYKWAMPDITLDPGAYFIIFASGKDRVGEELHTGFRLGDSDTELVWTDRTHRTVQTIKLPEKDKDNIALGMDADGEWRFYPQPTPNGPNTTKAFETIAQAGEHRVSGVRINEVSATQPAKSGAADWVELYNAGSSAVDLSQYFLSDSKKHIAKWKLSGTLQPGGYMLIKKVQADQKQDNLSLATAGETLYLTDDQGSLVDSFATGVLRAGTSSGLDANGQRVIFLTPTPGRPNGNHTSAGYCKTPVFSEQGGYKAEAFSLVITAPDGAAIYYTLDGSTPTSQSIHYTQPISVSQTQTVRAVAVQDGKLNSEQMVATYLFGAQHSLPVFCLSMTEGDWNYVFGSLDREDIRERNGYVEYYEPDGTLGVHFPAGFRTAGNSSRLYNQKNINLYLRGGYGRSAVDYPFFENYAITRFKSLSLRNMGQDISYTRLRDAYFSMAVNGLHIDNMQSRFCVVYLNGRYWGLYELKENQNEDYMESRYGVDRDTVGYARSNSWVFNGTGGQIIKGLFAEAKTDLSDDARFARYTSKIDVDAFNDYLIAQTFFANSDMYNQKYAGSNDGKLLWRPVYYDLDWSMMDLNPRRRVMNAYFNPDGIPVGKPNENGERWRVDTSLYYGLYQNAGWRKQFVERYAEVMHSTFQTEKLLALFDEMVEQIRSEMPATIRRWGSPKSMEEWEKQIKLLRDCLEKRRPYVIQELRDFFGVSNQEMERLFPGE